MLSEEEIKKLKRRYIDDLYAKTRAEQKLDLAFIDDTFQPTAVRPPHQVLRLGLGAEIVNSPAEQIVTSNPQAFVEVLKGDQEAGARISKVINSWIDVLKRQNPNPFKESVKNKLGRGENYIKVVHNELWVTKAKGKDDKGFPIFDRRGLPVLFLIPDPMVIYGSPEEDENGIPDRVIVFYERQPEEVIVRYPKWSNRKKDKELTEWFEFWDRDTVQFEADGEIVRRAPNPYKFPPFIRKYSGFGRRSPDGELSNLIVSNIRNSRGLIEEICVCFSDISSILHMSAHRGKTVLAAGKVNKEQLQQMQMGAYIVNVLDGLEDLAQFKIEDINIEQPSAETLVHVNSMMAELKQRHPLILSGFPWETSGRQQDMTQVKAMRRYDTVVDNTEIEWPSAFEKAFKVMRAIPTLVPEGLRLSDLDVEFKCSVKLKVKDPIEEDRLITLGDRLRRLPNPAIDLETFHTEFMGMTREKSKETIAKMLADMVTIYNPDIAAVMGMVAAEESGMERWLEMAKQRRQITEQQQQGLEQAPPITTQERTQGEVQTPLGREIGTIGTTGARTPPARYTRGGI